MRVATMTQSRIRPDAIRSDTAFGGQRAPLLLSLPLALSRTRHQAKARPEAIDVAEGRRVAQRAHHVGAVRHEQHPRGQRRRGAPRRAARATGGVVGVPGRSIDWVERVRPLSPFGRVGLADQDGARLPQPRGQQVVGLGHVIREQGRSPGGPDTSGCYEILHRERDAVQPAGRAIQPGISAVPHALIRCEEAAEAR